MLTKICTECHEEKDLIEFSKSKVERFGRKAKCKKCMSIINKKQYREKHKNDIKKPRKKYMKVRTVIYFNTCKVCNETKDICWFEFRKDQGNYRNICKVCKGKRYKEYRNKNIIKLRQYEQEYYKNPENRNRKIKNRRIRDAIRLKNDPKYRLRGLIKSSLREAFKLYSKNGKTKTSKQYGIDVEQIYNNIGPRPGSGKDWHLDHIIPVSIFNLDDPEHVKLAYSYINLRWLKSDINIKKSDKITDDVYKNKKLIEILKYIGYYEQNRDIFI